MLSAVTQLPSKSMSQFTAKSISKHDVEA